MVIRWVNNANRVSKNAFNTIGKIQKGIRYKKLEFHFNTSLTAVSLARMEQEDSGESDLPFSMSDINNRYYNDLLIQRFIAMSGIDVTDKKIQAAYQSMTQWGKIAA